MKTIADLPKDRTLGGTRFIYPGDGQKYYWHSQWAKGVWGKKALKAEQVFPLFVDSLEDALLWEVVS